MGKLIPDTNQNRREGKEYNPTFGLEVIPVIKYHPEEEDTDH